MDPVVQWLFAVDRQLGPEGFQLLKVLYLDTLRSTRRALTDKVQCPHDIYSQLCQDWKNGGEIGREEDHVIESSHMSPQHSLALLVHRLRLLVPQSALGDATKELRNKNLGAEECLSDLEKLGVTCSKVTFTLSQDSKALECLVKCYVNLTQLRRHELKIELARAVKIHGNNSTIFEIISELFAKQSRRNRCAGAIAMFVSSMQKAQAPKSTYVELQRNLSGAEIPHNQFTIPECDPVREIDSELKEVVVPVIRKEHHSIARRRSRKTALLCVCCCLPLILATIAAAVAFPVFSLHLKDNKFPLDDTGRLQIECPTSPPAASTEKAVMVIGEVNSFWYNKVSISQAKSGLYPNSYDYTTVDFLLVPSDQIHVLQRQYSCSYTSAYVHLVPYLLQGSTMNITTDISSTSKTTPGVLNLTICTTYPCLLYITDDYLEQYQLLVQPNKTNQTSILFTAPRDSFYYFTTASLSGDLNASLESYHVNMTQRQLNYTLWKNMESECDSECKCTSTGSPPNDCEIWIEKGSVFEAREYTVLAMSHDEDEIGLLTIKVHSRFLAYVVAAVAVGGILILGLIIVSLFLGGRHLVQRKREQHHGYVNVNYS